jgi:hypothetical protein
MSLRESVPLYDMRLQTSSRLHDIVQASRNADKVMMVTTVSTDRISRVQEDPKFSELIISFYPEDDENQPTKSDVKVIMPNSWTPKMYLAALNTSIRRNSTLSIESITIDGKIYATMNELEWLFKATEEDAHRQLTCSASYISVSGGVLKQA